MGNRLAKVKEHKSRAIGLNIAILFGKNYHIAARLESFDKSIDSGICRILIAEKTREYSYFNCDRSKTSGALRPSAPN